MKSVETKYKVLEVKTKVFNFMTYPLHKLAKVANKKVKSFYKEKTNKAINNASEKDYRKASKILIKIIYTRLYKCYQEGYNITEYIILDGLYGSSYWEWGTACQARDFFNEKQIKKFPFVYDKDKNQEFLRVLENEIVASGYFKVEIDKDLDGRRIMLLNIAKDL